MIPPRSAHGGKTIPIAISQGERLRLDVVAEITFPQSSIRISKSSALTFPSPLRSEQSLTSVG